MQLMTKQDIDLERHVLDHVSSGSSHRKLGLHAMPDGYALMLNADRTHYYWLRHDGVASVIAWDKWAVYRGARADRLAQEDKAE